MKDKIVLILQILAFVLIGYSFKAENESYALIGDMFFLGAILLGSKYDDIVAYAIIIPFTGLMPVGFFRLNICVIISILKLFLGGGKMTGALLLSSFYMFLSFIILNADTTFATLLCLMLYCIAVVFELDFSRVNYRRLAIMLLISLLGALTLIITSSSDLTMYVDAQNEQFKLGEEVRDLGGAMGISLYTCTGFACAFMLQRVEKGLVSILSALAMLFFIGVGLFALSRTFFTSLIISVILGVVFGSFDLFRMSKQEKWSLILVLGIVVCIIYYVIQNFGEDISTMFTKLESLYDVGGKTSRVGIWLSVLGYLITHPLTLIFGSGTNVYPTIESAKGYAFYGYGAHNLYLDTVMSFGVIGFIILVVLLKNLVRSIKTTNVYRKYYKGLVVFPLSMYFSCQLAQGSFRDTTSYIYPIVIIMVCYGLSYSRNAEIKNE